MGTLDRIELDRAVRSVVITGAGRAFSAGADIAAVQNHMRAGAPEAIAHFMRPGHRMTRRVETFPKPVIAAVNGLAFGGGCELVEATHIAIAAGILAPISERAFRFSFNRPIFRNGVGLASLSGA